MVLFNPSMYTEGEKNSMQIYIFGNYLLSLTRKIENSVNLSQEVSWFIYIL